MSYVVSENTGRSHVLVFLVEMLHCLLYERDQAGAILHEVLNCFDRF